MHFNTFLNERNILLILMKLKIEFILEQSNTYCQAQFQLSAQWKARLAYPHLIKPPTLLPMNVFFLAVEFCKQSRL